MTAIIDALRRFRAFVHQGGNNRVAYALAAFGFSFGLFAADYHSWRGQDFFVPADLFLVALSAVFALITLRAPAR